MESNLNSIDEARSRRRRMQMLQAVLDALAQPLLLVRQGRRRIKDQASENVRQSIEFLSHELEVAAGTLARRLAAVGGREARRGAWKKAAARLRLAWSDAAEWAHHLVVACRKCASRLCALFQAAQAMADRATSQLAYRVLRALEKELWLLGSNTLAPWPAAQWCPVR